MTVLDQKYFSWHEKHADSSKNFLENQLNSLTEGRIESGRIINHVSPPCDVTAYFRKRGYRSHYDFRNRNYCRVIFSDDFGEEYEMFVQYDSGLSNGFHLRMLSQPVLPF